MWKIIFVVVIYLIAISVSFQFGTTWTFYLLEKNPNGIAHIHYQDGKFYIRYELKNEPKPGNKYMYFSISEDYISEIQRKIRKEKDEET